MTTSRVFGPKSFDAAPSGCVIRDKVIAGLYFRKAKIGGSFYLYYRDTSGIERRPVIGKYPVVDVKEVRRRAMEILSRTSDVKSYTTSVTLDQVFSKYLLTDAKKISPSTLTMYYSIWKNWIEKQLGSRPIFYMTYAEWEELHSSMPKVLANRMKSFIQNLYNVAIKNDWYPSDRTPPICLVSSNREQPRREIMNSNALKVFGDTLIKWRSSDDVDEVMLSILLRTYLYTACRRNELLELTIDQYDSHTGTITLNESKTGYRLIALSTQAQDAIDEAISISLDSCDKVFNFKTHINTLWLRFKADAGLEGFSLHDIRRTVASVGFSNNMTIDKVGKILGHSSVKTTEGYAYLEVDKHREYSQKVSNSIDLVMFSDI